MPLRTDDIGRCDLCGAEEGERWQRSSDGAWCCAPCHFPANTFRDSSPPRDHTREPSNSVVSGSDAR